MYCFEKVWFSKCVRFWLLQLCPVAALWHIFRQALASVLGLGILVLPTMKAQHICHILHLVSVKERVGNFLADFYAVNGLVLESRKRREHLSEEDILRNKAIMESLSKGGSISEQNFEVRWNGEKSGFICKNVKSIHRDGEWCFLSPAREKTVPHCSCTQHHFLGRVHHSGARKVRTTLSLQLYFFIYNYRII